jgi:hypothetical protein
VSELDSFMSRFGRQTVDYKFYNGEVTLRFDKTPHEYFLVEDNGSLSLLKSVSKISHIVDKSQALIPWAVKVTTNKLLSLIPKTITKSGTEAVVMTYSDFEEAVMKSKTAHKEKLDDAGLIGNVVHDWLERYAKLRIGGNCTEEILSKFPYDPRAENGCKAALEWAERHNVRWIAAEQKIYSRQHRYPGTLDGKALTDSCNDKSCCPFEFKDHLSLIDYKTSNGLYVDFILQVAAYRYADWEENQTDYDDAWIIRLDKADGSFAAWYLDLDCLELGWKAFRSALMLTNDIQALEEYQTARKTAQKAVKKVQKAEAKAVKLELECIGHKKYKGIRFPRCNKGKPCKSCLKVYNEKHEIQTAKPDEGYSFLDSTSGNQQFDTGSPSNSSSQGLPGTLLLTSDSNS